MVLIASLTLFLALRFGFLTDPFAESLEEGPAFRGSQRSSAVRPTVELGWDSPDCNVASHPSSLYGGNLSIGLAIGWELDALGDCHSECLIEGRRPMPVTVVVVMLQPRIYT